MKHILLAVTLLFSLTLQSQPETKQPKLRYSAGFLSTKWELGDKDVTEKDVRLHLEKHSSEAYHHWRKAEGNGKAALAFSIIMAGGFIVGLVGQENETKAIGYGVAAGAGIVTLVTYLSASSNADKAVNTYNRKFGY